jgi:hypothetical protein
MSLDVYLTKTVPSTVFSCNITHNLNKMAEEAGIYKHLWYPESIGMTKALDLIRPLTKAIELMEENPVRFRKLNPSNGWGTYEDLLNFVKQYLAACVEHPDADIGVSR